ncbi:hypothetical protein MCHLDSM_03822 [Mycolicibacterium chlorophenolicum]|uniref:Uncharacterized protein n=2 Tax=Mycolicibacterium chlorophenolicum TaxID=37916 RepID=A0A0J6YL27_9MYCO|nr:hypothetical protein MCHLDSM_03822 [Mycolicibacterium chlorophenolicum]
MIITPDRRLTWMRVGVGLAAALGIAVAIGVPSALLPNSFFVRMTPAPWWSYAAWAVTAVLSGALIATYVHAASATPRAPSRAGFAATLGSMLAVGCPVCNKLVIAALGVSGALQVWAPLQPVLAVASLTLLGWALWRRLSTLRSCPVGSSPAAAAEDRHQPAPGQL